MNRPLDAELELARVVEEVQRRAAPDPRDRARISEMLRAQLGAQVVDGLAPGSLQAGSPQAQGGSPQAQAGSAMRGGRQRDLGARVSAGRGGWMAAVVGTGVVMGALGFAVGYGLGAQGRSAVTTVGPAPTGEPGAVAAVIDAPPLVADRSPGAVREVTAPTAPALQELPRVTNEPVVQEGVRERLAAGGERASARVPKAPKAALAQSASFAEAVEKLRRANRALSQGRAPLSLILLEELARTAPETLAAERETTRILALCAVGEVEAARRAAEDLRAAGGGSIYARRIEQSCARPLAPARR